jgi:hypothetical protein
LYYHANILNNRLKREALYGKREKWSGPMTCQQEGAMMSEKEKKERPIKRIVQ